MIPQIIDILFVEHRHLEELHTIANGCSMQIIRANVYIKLTLALFTPITIVQPTGHGPAGQMLPFAALVRMLSILLR